MNCIQIFSPLAIANNRGSADYYIYIKEYKNGRRCFKAFCGMATKPFICYRTTDLTIQEFWDKHFSRYTEENGWKIVTY